MPLQVVERQQAGGRRQEQTGRRGPGYPLSPAMVSSDLAPMQGGAAQKWRPCMGKSGGLGPWPPSPSQIHLCGSRPSLALRRLSAPRQHAVQCRHLCARPGGASGPARCPASRSHRQRPVCTCCTVTSSSHAPLQPSQRLPCAPRALQALHHRVPGGAGQAGRSAGWRARRVAADRRGAPQSWEAGAAGAIAAPPRRQPADMSPAGERRAAAAAVQVASHLTLPPPPAPPRCRAVCQCAEL